MNLQLQINFESDWHIGDGTSGIAEIDKLVRRHAVDALPYVPGKTISGIWRDAVQQVAHGLCADGEDGSGATWGAWIDVCFGNEPVLLAKDKTPRTLVPRSGALEVESAVFNAPLRGRLQNFPFKRKLTTETDSTALHDEHLLRNHLRRALFSVKPGVSIDPNSGTARDDFLRFVEMTRGDLQLVTPPMTLHLEDDAAHTACALLWAGAMVVERLGAQRRRGSGRCKWTLLADGQPIDPAAMLLVLQSAPPSPPATSLHAINWSNTALKDVALGDAVQTQRPWTAVTLRLHLRTPVIVSNAIVGNELQSRDYLPGTLLLPHVAKSLRGAGLTEGQLGVAIRAGRIRVGNGYPVIYGGQSTGSGGRPSKTRALPMPFCLQRWKQEEAFGNTSYPVVNRMVRSSGGGSQLSPMRDGYVVEASTQDLACGGIAKGDIIRVDQPTRFSTHNTVEDVAQRPTTAVGGVYTYESLVEGSELASALWLAPEVIEALERQDGNWLSKLESDDYRVGRSKRVEYGRVSISARTANSQSDTRHVNGTLSVWMVSDLLAFDAALGPATTVQALQRELERAFKKCDITIKLAPASEDEDNKHLVCDSLRVQRNDGWNRRWGDAGLPRPSQVTIQAGSVAKFTILSVDDGSGGNMLTTDMLTRVEQRGLGGRRAEGYGEVRLNDPTVTRDFDGHRMHEQDDVGSSTSVDALAKSAADLTGLASNELELCEALYRTAWEREIRRLAQTVVADKEWRKKHLKWSSDSPTNAQLGTWRMVLSRADNNSADSLKTWLEGAVKRDFWSKPAADAMVALMGWRKEKDKEGEEQWVSHRSGIVFTALVAPSTQAHDGVHKDAHKAVFQLTRGRTSDDKDSLFCKLANELWIDAFRAISLLAIRAETRARREDEQKNLRPSGGGGTETGEGEAA